MSQIVPLSSVKPVDSLVVFQQVKITPARILELPKGGTVYEFAKVNWTGITRKEGEYVEPHKEIALIVVAGDKKSFRVQYYSVADGTQIIHDLTVDKLAETVQNLKDAGF